MPRSLKTISWRRGIVIDLPKKKKHRPGNIQAEAEPPDDQALRLLNHTVSSPACRVRAHRSGKLKELRELAAEFDVTPASLQHAEAMDLQSK